MALSLSIGTVVITINPAALLSPVIARPSSTAAVYATFKESVQANGLAATIFNAFRSVVEVNDHAKSKAKWPTRYGTTDKPWGQPANSDTGEREESVIDDEVSLRWSSAIQETAKGRKSFLEHYAELAEGIATGVKVGIEQVLRRGRVTVGPGGVIVYVEHLSDQSEIFIQPRGQNALAQIGDIEFGNPGRFTITGSIGEVGWLVVG